jgi:SAM-dependent methyltransferase
VAEFHFVEDYERYVADLVARHPIDEAMSLAVGGWFEHIGLVEAAAMRHVGLHDSMALIDLGCGSGRLAWALGRQMQLDYLGIDVVQALLDYAASKSPPEYRFVLNRTLSIPAPDGSADMVCAFSVFTHLLHAESYIYMDDIRRALRPGGRLVFSFLEFAMPSNWDVFVATVDGQRNSRQPHLNQFIERNVIAAWADRLGYRVQAFIDATANPWGEPGSLGQSIAILQLP